VLREAMLAGKRRDEDDALIARYIAGPGRGHDPAPLVSFVRHVRADLGPRATICDVEIRGDPRNVREWVVWYFFPGESAPTAVAAPQVADVPNRASEGALDALRAAAPGDALGPVSGAGPASSGAQAGHTLGVAADRDFGAEAGQAFSGTAGASDLLTSREGLSRPLRPMLPTTRSTQRRAMPMQRMGESGGMTPALPALPAEEQGIAASWQPALKPTFPEWTADDADGGTPA
jgi:hypothetical protein